MQTWSQSERITFAKAKTLPSEETSQAISQSTTNESPLDTESIINNRKIYDLADFISKSHGGQEKHNVQSLNKDEKYQYLVKSKKCFDAEILITKSYTKSNKISWLDQYSWHMYIPHLNVALCNVCVLFNYPDVKNRSMFVKKAFQDLSKLEKVKEHNNLQYHKAAMFTARKFRENFEEVSHGVDHDPNKEIKF